MPRSSLSNSTLQPYKNLTSGLSAVVTNQKPNNIMMDAVMIAKLQEEQKKDIENRIVKLNMEEERAAKRIKELQRRQNFVKEMNNDKTMRLNT